LKITVEKNAMVIFTSRTNVPPCWSFHVGSLDWRPSFIFFGFGSYVTCWLWDLVRMVPETHVVFSRSW